MIKRCIKNLLLLILLTGFSNAFSAIKLPGLVADNMVLQRDAKVSIWGWANPGENIVIQFRGKAYNTKAERNGKWLVKLNPSPAGGPFDMDIKSNTDHIQVKNVLMGDVWLCGGQSNMVLDFNNEGVKTLYAKDIENSANDNIRQVIVNRTYSFYPADNYKTSGWRMAGPKTLASFSAAAYFFARNLYEKYHVPIGLINDCIGGTIAEAWTSEKGLKELPEFNKDIAFLKDSAAVKQKINTAKADFAQWETTIVQSDKGFDALHTATWAGSDFDDSQWKQMAEPEFWDKSGLKNTYGVIWLRKEVNIPETWVGKDAMLSLGQIDDADITYFNGTQIGKTINRDFKRNYTVAAQLIKPGKNVITIRVTNYNGTGGMFPENNLQLVSGTQTISLNGNWKYQEGIKMPVRPGTYDPKNLATSLYNGMIAPLTPIELKGVIWYQGEYNTHRAYEYRKLFKALITDWREHFTNKPNNKDPLPFIFVQLPNFQPVVDHPVENEWAELREAQLMALSLPNTGMAITIDAGGLELHPADKKDVGDRLAFAARRLAYGDKDITAWGPIYKSAIRDGNKMVVTLDDGGSKLVSKDGKALRYFAIAGDDHKFVWAIAEIKDNKVEVWSPLVPYPVAVRYAWAGNPDGCNLYNEGGLPASPFRSDDWAGLTDNNLAQ